MTFTVNTNPTTLNVKKNHDKPSDTLSKLISRSSSGLTINSAKNDAAGTLEEQRTETSPLEGEQHRTDEELPKGS